MAPNLDRIRGEFGATPFGVSEAYSRGFSRGMLRNQQLARPHRGVRVHGSAEVSLVGRALALLPKLRPGDRLSHATALALMGCPVHVGIEAPVDVASAPGTAPMRRSRVRGHRSGSLSTLQLRLPAGMWTEHAVIVPVSPPCIALAEASSVLPGPELVVAIDHLLRSERAHYDPAAALSETALAHCVAVSAGARGARRLRIAIGLARAGVDSRMETLLRLVAESAGVDDLTTQGLVHAPDGRVIGRFDLVAPASQRFFEYDGDQHRTSRAQYLRDIARYDGARDAGWKGSRFHARDVLRAPDETAERILHALGRKRRRISTALAKFLMEAEPGPTESALPR